MSHVVSMRLKENQLSRLRRVARRQGHTPSETGAMLLEEGLRRAEFACIDFRDSPVGRQAFVSESHLAVWEVVLVARGYEMDPGKTAKHLNWPLFRVRAALNYAAAFPEEIEAAIEDNCAYDYQVLSRLLPEVTRFQASNSASQSTRRSRAKGRCSRASTPAR